MKESTKIKSIANIKSKWYWICQLVGWGGFILISFSMTYLFLGEYRLKNFIILITSTGLFMVITHIGRSYLKKKNVFQKELNQILYYLVSFAFISTTVGVIFIHLPPILIEQTLDVVQLKDVYMTFTNIGVIFLLWATIYGGFQIFDNYRKNEIRKIQLEAKLLETELLALKAQINPHFLFNALNNIKSLILEDQERSRNAISALCSILRGALRLEKEMMIPIEEEIALVKDYLNLEKIHLEERLDVCWNVQELKNNYLVPALGIQTLVENAIKHGTSDSKFKGNITISLLEEDEGKLKVRISNPGNFNYDKKKCEGIGLRNLRKRLKLMSQETNFVIKETKNSRVNAELILYSDESTNNR